jgi:AraC family transcriptional regulator
MNRTIYKDDHKNAIRSSLINRYEGDIPFTGLGIKYVVSGVESYYANGKKYIVKEGEYIIGNDFTTSIVQINHPSTVRGLCIDLSTHIVSEVADYHDYSPEDLKSFLLSDQFLVNRYNAKNTSLGYTLDELNRKILNGSIHNDFLQNELFYSLAESIITDQRFVFDHLRKLNFKKSDTNEDLCRKLIDAKSLIDENLLDNLSLDEIIAQIGISKYHFIRLFKQSFGLSPYQYQKRIRMNHAREELLSGKTAIDVAVSLGYTDLSSFSKAFKQLFGYAPGSIKK